MATLKWLKSGGNYYYFDDAPIHASSITLNKNSISLTTAGQTEQLTATVSPDDAVEKKPHWSSSNLTVAFVDQTGLVTCINPGECTITAECDGVSASCSIVNNIFINLLAIGGGGGGGRGCNYSGGAGGGGGGAVICCSCLSNTDKEYTITIGAGGSGGTRYVCSVDGGNTCISYNSGNIIANGGQKGACVISGQTDRRRGGASGSGCSGGGAGGSGCQGGGGGGASGNGGVGVSSSHAGNGGAGLYGYGGGGGGGGDNYPGGTGCDGGGNGGGASGCGGDATNYGGGGGGSGYCGYDAQHGGAGCQGMVEICYKTDGSYGITTATGGDCCYTCNGYCVHRFTSSGTFCIIS